MPTNGENQNRSVASKHRFMPQTLPEAPRRTRRTTSDLPR